MPNNFVHEPIAIIGSGCRLPGGASSPSKLWDLLRNPRDLLRKIDRFDVDGFYHPDGRHHGTANVQHAHLLDEDFRLFDAGFFGIKPVEAESIDPLQRLLLETVYESLENAGIPLERLQGSDTAFYAGVMATDYTDLLMRDVDTIPQYFATATARSIISNRVSYVFDWHGPSMTIDTACSSSMLALHGAITSLRTGESKVAVAAGGNLILGPELFIALSKVNMLSPRGRSHMWDASADGYGRGEGFVSVVLKPLGDAIRDGDNIHCVIRESATNQDGRTMGITMPSAHAQADLIRKAYANVGLDVRNPSDRPQFFEAHGTGTKAGDPQEAEAIYSAFFGRGTVGSSEPKHPLYVGGIKTVVGHTEGTAGLSGLLKASLALQAGEIPPNLLFESLNPDLIPFYGPLEIPTQISAWPELPVGVPRRASVNSFGFGGANTHVILESYVPPEDNATTRGGVWTGASAIIPFVFSASSESALQRTLSSYQEYLLQYPNTNLSDLSWTLRARRSALPVKVALSASTVEELRHEIGKRLDGLEKTPDTSIGTRSSTGDRRILGVFTGQGAQWAQMGKDLLNTVPRAKEIVVKLDNALQNLPRPYRPSWRIADELLKDATASRMGEAAFSQPLCTVVQIILVDLLRTAGIRFSAVVGHSSGEIGAAHAAGFLSPEDATKVAYLRGFYAGLAQGSSGEKGAMMAVGCSMEEAIELCDKPEFRGKIKLAASNSSSSVTLSGDADAISRAKIMLDERKTFARLLKVDTAYHSHHMQPCAEPYVEALDAAGITIQTPDDDCVWYSSVLDGARMRPNDALRTTYWRDNMVNAVLFSQAVTSAVQNGGPTHFALEVGPHPALKGPASQTLAELNIEIPYAGTLKRGANDLLALSECLGSVWTHFGASAMNFEEVHALLPDSGRPTLLKNLPTYSWDHDRVYWYESRKSEQYRTRSQPPHQLLGSRVDDGTENELRWRIFLSVQQIPWLEGHKIQGQVVFPAAGYVSMVLEAAQMMAGETDSVQLLEVEDLDISRAIVFSDEKTGVETTTTLSAIERDAGSAVASFVISAHLSQNSTHLTKVASGTVRVVFDPSSSSLPPRAATPAHLIPIDSDRFYSSLETVGYGYTREFRTCSNMRRRLDFCTGFIEKSEDDQLLVHPGVLDQAFQAMFGAYSWPGDGRFWALFLPRTVKKITVVPSLFRAEQESRLAFDAWLVDSPSNEMRGDVVFFAGDKTLIQVEGASMVSVSQTTARDDRSMFFETIWGVAAPNGEVAVAGDRATPEEWELAEACERVAHYYWRRLDETLTPYEREHCAENHMHLLKAIRHLLDRPMDGRHSYLKPEWRHDDEKVIEDLMRQYPSSIDIKLSVSVGRALPAVIRGETTMLEHMRPDNMLDDFYAQSLGLPASNRWLGKMVKQLAHRYPRMNFIEIGAGTGSSTQAVLDALGNAYSSYTFTDISSGFFEKAAARFESASDKMIFKTLDVEKSVSDQGYTPQSYDVVIASNVLHATTNLHNTLVNTRSLLKPGGFLFLLEITDNTTIRYSFSMGGLSGWWLGVNDGRPYSPCITPSKWNRALRKAGFAGVDAITPARDLYPNPFSVIASQAVDDRMDRLRRPLLPAGYRAESSILYVLGGVQLDTFQIVDDVVGVAGHLFTDVNIIDTLDDILDAGILPDATILNLLDLDEPVFKDVTPQRLKALQLLVENSRNLLWVTYAQERENPWANASVGFLRSVAAEQPTLRAQVLDFAAADKPLSNTRVISEALLRLVATDSWERDPAFKDQLLWTTEPELRFRDDKLWVPRVMVHQDNNDRLNVSRRSIKRGVDEETTVRLIEENGSWALKQRYMPSALVSQAVKDTITVRVRYSSLRALKVDSKVGSSFLVVGQALGSERWVICLSTERSSVISVNQALAMNLPDGFTEAEAPGLLKKVLSYSLAGHIVSQASGRSGTLLVHEPDATLASVLTAHAIKSKFKVRFTTQKSEHSNSADWVYLHPRQTPRVALQALPKDVFAFVCIDHGNKLVELIKSTLPASCKVIEEDLAFHQQPVSLPGVSPSEVGLRLAALVDNTPSSFSVNGDVVSLSDLLQQDTGDHVSPLALIDWSLWPSLAVEVSPAAPSALFRADRSYMLVGMTGEMGQSLCRWMIRHGAGAVIMTSRNPKIERAWIDELEATGAKVKVAGFDATSRDAWIRFSEEIKRDLPPLAGIINGAVVLQDKFFLEMDINTFNGTLKPKVDSTIYLDEVFGDYPLDFFLVFSSLSSIIGNRGQANYNAANAFMTSFIQQRIARGQPASVLELGSVVGVGFLTRAGDVMEQILVKYGYLPVSEVDLQHMVAQCIMAGLPGSGENPDIISGLRYAYEGEDTGVHWVNNPRFSHMVLPPERDPVETGGKKTVLPARTQLAAAKSEQEAIKALETCFGTKLRAMLQMDESSFRHDAPLIEMGVDSLVAVEIRSWFLKEVGVDMAVLKILGGASTTGLCQFAVEQMPRELLPGIGAGDVAAVEPTIPAPVAVEKPSVSDTPKSVGSESGEDSSYVHVQPTASIMTSASDTASLVALTPPQVEGAGGSSASSVLEEDVPSTKPVPEVIRRVRVSSAQSRFWFLSMFLSDQTASNVTLSYNIRGKVRIEAFARALKQTVNAHEALRTCFIADENSAEKAWQGVMKTSKVELNHKTVSTDEEISAAYKRVRNTIYDLEQGETMQVVLLSKDSLTHTIIFGYHHIVLDGVGFTSFVADLERAYNGQAPSPMGLRYSEFAEKEGIAIEKGSLEKNLAYWKGEFQEVPPLLPLLPVSKTTTRKAISKYGSSYVEQRLDPKLAANLKLVCRQFHATSSHFYLAVFRIMLARLAGVDDLCIGLADANRHDSNVMSTVGLFLNMLPLRFKHLPDTPFGEVLKGTRVKVYEGLGHAGVPFDDLLQALKVPRSSGNSPLFQAFFDYHTGAQEKLQFADTTWQNADRNPGERAYDITLDVIEGSAGSLVALIGQEYLYGVPEMQKLLDCYLTLLEQFVNNPLLTCNAAKLFSNKQIQEALGLGQGRSMDFKWSETLGHRVHEICQQRPDSIAVRDGRGVVSLSYRDLERKAREIKDELLKRGVKQGDKIGVLQEASPDWICSLIAIFWAGGVYVPMVLLNPVPRLNAIIQAARPTVILVHKATTQLSSQLQTLGAAVVNVDRVVSTLTGLETIKSIPVTGEDPAVILFTSGSTGTPKGIVLRHRNLVNHMEGYVRNWNIGREVVLQQSAFSFDLSIGQIFTALSMGGTLVVAPEDARRDPRLLASLIHQENVTWTLLTPSEYSGILQAAPQELRQASSWKHALACGETLPRKLVREFAKLGHGSVRLYNCYGPAEAIISATMAEIPFLDGGDDGPVTVGQPNVNYSIHIIDEQRNPVPQGFPGEIVIGGCGVGVGYLNEEGLTKDKFLVNKFASDSDLRHGWNMCYRTGDMGRLRADGTLMHEGRLEGDSQVKIRGFRVDLLDIESTLLNEANGAIADAVVTLRSEAQILVAHVIFAQDQQSVPDKAAYLKDLLASLPLPAYMRPTVAVPVADFPKNLHGKKDRKAILSLPLPQLSGSPSGDADAETLSSVEKRLAEAWLDVLPADFASNFTIGSGTDFFAVGGNSLLLVKLQGRIRGVFNVSLPLIQLLDASILSQMAALVEASHTVETVDWEKETAVDKDLLKLSGQSSAQPSLKQHGKIVLLTGATGYLGPYLLQQLISDDSISAIHCVAVRADTLSQAKSRLHPSVASSSKIIVHVGDLGSPLLGLSTSVFSELVSSVDLIIHSGARRSFWDSYYSLRDTNVTSTRTLLHLACPRRVPIHFLSTSGVLLLSDATNPYLSASPAPETSVAGFRPPIDGSEGYAASKWASEVLLENASRQLRIPITIHRFTPRPASIPAVGGVKDAALEELATVTERLGVIPERSTWAGRFDVVRSEGLARGVVHGVVFGTAAGGTVRFVHHQGEATITPKEMFDYLEGRLPGVEERMGLLEWVGAVKREGYGWLFSTHDLSLRRGERGRETVVVNQR
ncbi:hypothetical protein QBC40DRAFT_261048 [Triangularia verruculosa]|uniref:Uncharacterized protein n=1 Tax=Triangularia verruculosa TaxID=2587418 RepID=A0AAN7AZ68_9PEZI|nr:hypothetical protein QBC40DRAFT_261048 [Triangularia verruculosa]